MDKKSLVKNDEVLFTVPNCQISKTDDIEARGKPRKDTSSVASILVAILLVILAIVALVYTWFHLTTRTDCVGALQYAYFTGDVYLNDNSSRGERNYFGTFGEGLRQRSSAMKRTPIHNGFEYTFPNIAKLQIQKYNSFCTSVKWDYLGSSRQDNSYPVDCFSIVEYWYGGSELYNQIWPLDKAEIPFAPYYPTDMITEYDHHHPAFGPVLGRYWLHFKGIAILANKSSPLIVSINSYKKNSLCLSIDPSLYPPSVQPTLQYKVCRGDNVKTLHQAMLQEFFKKPTKGPDMQMMRDPVWSTWVKYGVGVTQSDVEEFLDEIVSHNFSCSQIEIDNMYTTAQGDLDFDPVKFPDPKAMMAKIHDAGCRVTTWVHPFANIESKAYDEGKANDYFVLGPDGYLRLVKWWGGIAGAVDFTNPEAYRWYFNRLKQFQSTYNIDSFKFDGGSCSYLPYQYQLNATKAMPSDYSVAYATLASEINNMVEVRVGDNSQNLPVFVRFLDRDASWSNMMGLQSVIPTVLTLGILGYPFILSDMIGGNGNPDKELYIRWLQLNAFLPSMQFSHAPWDFDTETVNITRSMMQVRDEIFPTLIEGVENAVKTGEPIIRPLWWIAPTDLLEASKITQQFMVMDMYLVAPVTLPQAALAHVYLPKGTWKEMFRGNVIHSVNYTGQTLTYYNVTLYDVFYFKNMTGLKQNNLA